MSSIAVPTPTEDARSAAIVAAVRTALGALVLTLLLVTFTPFEQVSEGTAVAGNALNQIGYGGLGALALGVHLLFTERHVALSLLRPAWLLMAGWLVFSALHTPDPLAALRTIAFTLAAMAAVTAALCLPPSTNAFRVALATAALVALALSFAGVLALPALAIHDAAGPEPQHAGLWRGHFSHKNVAGAVMAALFFAGIYLLRSRWFVVGTLISVGALVFVLQTGSKTSALLLPMVASLVVFGRLLGGRGLVVLVLVAALSGLALVTLGSVLFPPVDALLQAALPGTTFTGRTDIWRFAIESLRGHLWTGFGFESFWRTGAVLSLEPSWELSWDPRGTPNAHNGYLEMAMATGLPGLALTILVLAVLPLKDFLFCAKDEETRRLADMFLMILVLGLMNSFLESYLFDRGNPIWMTLFMAVVGLRLLARHSVVAGR